MKLETIKGMILSLRKELTAARALSEEDEARIANYAATHKGTFGYIRPSRNRTNDPAVYAKLKNIIGNSLKLLPDDRSFFVNTWNEWDGSVEDGDKDALSTNQIDDAVGILDYILELIKLEEKSQEQVRQRKFFADAEEKLKEAGSSFGKEDYPSTMNKLNTALELVLKEVAEIPSTISKINTARIIELWVSNKLPYSIYLSEARKCVLDIDNKIKHLAYKPTQVDCIKGMASIENLFKKFKGMKLPEDMKTKLYEGVNV